jgi:hypothetical protein
MMWQEFEHGRMESREGGAASLVWRFNWGGICKKRWFSRSSRSIIELSVSTEPRQILSPSTSAVLGALPGTPCSLAATLADWHTAARLLVAACRRAGLNFGGLWSGRGRGLECGNHADNEGLRCDTRCCCGTVIIIPGMAWSQDEAAI